MRRTWQVRRDVVEQPDGQARWDRAYQLLLRWGTVATPSEGGTDARGILCAGVDGPAATGADDRAADRAAPGVCRRPGRLAGSEEHIFRDDGQSGGKLDRPGLDAVRDHAAQASFDVVLITAPDRLARTYVHQMIVLEELERRGVRVVFIDRPPSDDPHEQLVVQIRGTAAEAGWTLARKV